MIVAAIDVSGSIDFVPHYKKTVYSVLSSLKPPIRVILWHSAVHSVQTCDVIDQSLMQFSGMGGTRPQVFFECLPENTPITLYIFTDGQIYQSDVNKCHSILKTCSIEITEVFLNYIGEKSDMNLRFTNVFDKIPQHLYINGDFTAHMLPDIDFDTLHYKDIMKDDSFKATVLKMLNSGNQEITQLKKKVCSLSTRILSELSSELTIHPFYVKRDVAGCIQYVRNHSFNEDKRNFQRKISEILTLFDPKTDTYSLNCFEQTPQNTLPCLKVPIKETEEPLDSAYLTCDILYEKCQLACIPVKMCNDDVWPDKKTLRNPFKLLESDWHIQRIVRQVEPFVMDYQKTYQTLKKTLSSQPDISKGADIASPFTRDPLQGVYILHNDSIDVSAMIKHNNYVLSTFFQNTLPGKPVLWHMIFLYIIAMNRFQEKKQILFEEIRFLGQQDSYFITLSPQLDPPIVDTLNCCFWYIAHVCPKAFPNSRKNVLRRDFISGVFLEFYRDVYEENYTYPTMMPFWQCWHTLFYDKLSIFSILSHYYQHEEIQSVDNGFNLILYRVSKPFTSSHTFPFLSQLNLETVLNIYGMRQSKNLTLYANLHGIPKQNVSLYNENEETDDQLLSHVQINLKTCHPYVKCPVTHKHWQDCIGNYNVKKHSYVRLFKRYCEEYEKYPQSGDDLLCFLNKYIYEAKGKVPEVFPLTVKQHMKQVFDIFQQVMTFPCQKYLIIANHLYSEEDRRKLESNK